MWQKCQIILPWRPGRPSSASVQRCWSRCSSSSRCDPFPAVRQALLPTAEEPATSAILVRSLTARPMPRRGSATRRRRGWAARRRMPTSSRRCRKCATSSVQCPPPASRSIPRISSSIPSSINSTRRPLDPKRHGWRLRDRHHPDWKPNTGDPIPKTSMS